MIAVNRQTPSQYQQEIELCLKLMLSIVKSKVLKIYTEYLDKTYLNLMDRQIITRKMFR